MSSRNADIEDVSFTGVSSGLIAFKNLGFFKAQAGEISNIKPAENSLELSPTFLKLNYILYRIDDLQQLTAHKVDQNLIDN